MDDTFRKIGRDTDYFVKYHIFYHPDYIKVLHGKMHLKNNSNKIKQKRNTQLKVKLQGVFKLTEQKTLKVEIFFLAD